MYDCYYRFEISYLFLFRKGGNFERQEHWDSEKIHYWKTIEADQREFRRLKKGKKSR